MFENSPFRFLKWTHLLGVRSYIICLKTVRFGFSNELICWGCVPILYVWKQSVSVSQMNSFVGGAFLYYMFENSRFRFLRWTHLLGVRSYIICLKTVRFGFSGELICWGAFLYYMFENSPLRFLRWTHLLGVRSYIICLKTVRFGFSGELICWGYVPILYVWKQSVSVSQVNSFVGVRSGVWKQCVPEWISFRLTSLHWRIWSSRHDTVENAESFYLML